MNNPQINSSLFNGACCTYAHNYSLRGLILSLNQCTIVINLHESTGGGASRSSGNQLIISVFLLTFDIGTLRDCWRGRRGVDGGFLPKQATV